MSFRSGTMRSGKVISARPLVALLLHYSVSTLQSLACACYRFDRVIIHYGTKCTEVFMAWNRGGGGFLAAKVSVGLRAKFFRSILLMNIDAWDAHLLIELRP
ncbi:hypothetical protein K474DRAFT_1714388 [Panus rudis PR-1116 ss-1]|nr:hypothetical protein K474DRAFT_1714388 [Panus rudis PR-1116 ss-1]